MSRSKKFHDLLIKRLKDPKEAAAYFEAILEECKELDEQESMELVLAALKDITDAQGGIAALVKKTKLKRQNITRSLSPIGNPKLSTIITIKDALLSPHLNKK